MAKAKRTGWLKDPKKAREGEVIGGGFWIFRRGDGTKRIRPAMWPFEYGSIADAQKQAEKLARNHPGETFIIVGQCDTWRVEPVAAQAA